MATMESLDEERRIIFDGGRAPHGILSSKLDLRCGGVPDCAADVLDISAVSQDNHEVKI